MKVFVKSLLGHTVTLEVEVSDTIKDIKDKLEKKQGNDNFKNFENCKITGLSKLQIFSGWADQSLAISDGVKLLDEKTLSYYNIKNNSNIYVSLRRFRR